MQCLYKIYLSTSYNMINKMFFFFRHNKDFHTWKNETIMQCGDRILGLGVGIWRIVFLTVESKGADIISPMDLCFFSNLLVSVCIFNKTH